MSTLKKLAHSLGRRDAVPNQELAKELAATRNEAGIREIVKGLKSADRNIQSDCIKVVYEIGYIAPELIAEYVAEFLHLLRSRNNRLVWGSMIALATIAELKAPELYAQRGEILQAIEKGSVITIDNGIKTLAKVASQKSDYRRELCPYLLGHLAKCRPKDVPQRAEKIMVAIDTDNKQDFIDAVESRIPYMKPSQVKRLQKVIRAAEKQ